MAGEWVKVKRTRRAWVKIERLTPHDFHVIVDTLEDSIESLAEKVYKLEREGENGEIFKSHKGQLQERVDILKALGEGETNRLLEDLKRRNLIAK